MKPPSHTVAVRTQQREIAQLQPRQPVLGPQRALRLHPPRHGRPPAWAAPRGRASPPAPRQCRRRSAARAGRHARTAEHRTSQGALGGHKSLSRDGLHRVQVSVAHAPASTSACHGYRAKVSLDKFPWIITITIDCVDCGFQCVHTDSCAHYLRKKGICGEVSAARSAHPAQARRPDRTCCSHRTSCAHPPPQPSLAAADAASTHLQPQPASQTPT